MVSRYARYFSVLIVFLLSFSSSLNCETGHKSIMEKNTSFQKGIKQNTLVDEIKMNSKAVFEMKDSNGLKYMAYFFSGNARKEIANSWAGANEGDVLYTGDFGLAIQKENSKDIIVYPEVFKNFVYNKSRENVYLISSRDISQPDILAVSWTLTSNYDSAELFYIKDGRFSNIRQLSYSARPKLVGKNTIQVAYYCHPTNDNPWGFYFITFKFDDQRGSLEEIGRKDYFDDYHTGRKVFEQWKQDADFVVE